MNADLVDPDPLAAGVVRADVRGSPVLFRLVGATDDLERVTEMLHAAYRPLAEAGLRFVASHQDITTTRARMAVGESLGAVADGHLVGVITWWRAAARPGSAAHYSRPDVAKCGQFAVDPARQRCGIGSALMSLVEERAAAAGFRHLALDTAEGATDLIAFYAARGFRPVEHVQWREVNYRSVILSKALGVA